MFNVNVKAATFGIVAAMISTQAFAQVAVRSRTGVKDTVRSEKAAVEAPSTKATNENVNSWKNSSALSEKSNVVAFPTGEAIDTEEQAPSCNVVLKPGAMAANTRTQEARVADIIASGALKRGTCKENPEDIPDAKIKQIVLDTADDMLTKGTHKLRGAAYISSGSKSLQNAYKLAGIDISFEDAKSRFVSVRKKCGWW